MALVVHNVQLASELLRPTPIPPRRVSVGRAARLAWVTPILGPMLLFVILLVAVTYLLVGEWAARPRDHVVETIGVFAFLLFGWALMATAIVKRIWDIYTAFQGAPLGIAVISDLAISKPGGWGPTSEARYKGSARGRWRVESAGRIWDENFYVDASWSQGLAVGSKVRLLADPRREVTLVVVGPDN